MVELRDGDSQVGGLYFSRARAVVHPSQGARTCVHRSRLLRRVAGVGGWETGIQHGAQRLEQLELVPAVIGNTRGEIRRQRRRGGRTRRGLEGGPAPAGFLRPRPKNRGKGG